MFLTYHEKNDVGKEYIPRPDSSNAEASPREKFRLCFQLLKIQTPWLAHPNAMLFKVRDPTGVM
jgi:hypothetical protein